MTEAPIPEQETVDTLIEIRDIFKEVLDVLKQDLEMRKKRMKAIETSQSASQKQPRKTSKKAPAPSRTDTFPDDVYKEALPDLVYKALQPYLDDLDTDFDGETVTVRPRRYLGKELWSEINAAIRNIGGGWVSAGKDGRWTI